MALDFEQVIFPTKVIDLFVGEVESVDDRIHVFRRRLRMADPAISAGVLADAWSPVTNSREIMGESLMGQHTATLNNYDVIVQGLIIDTDEERGLLKHYALANVLRTTLAFSEPLAISLSQATSVVVNGYEESLKKWSAVEQRYYTADLGSSKWAYMSILKINLQTETRRVG